jgi:Domain of unknown function (DUF4262)
MNPAEAKILADVATYGWHVMNVMPDDPHPPHSFSIGLQQTFEHPEIVIVGLRGETAQIFINDIGQQIRKGEVYEAGVRYSELAKGFPVTFAKVSVEYFPEYLGWALWFYRGRPFTALQMIWPDRAGAFPWEDRFSSDLRTVQPVLASVT